MALSERYDGIRSKRLRHGFAMQEVENSPATDEEIELFRRMENKGWSGDRQARFVIARVKRRYRTKPQPNSKIVKLNG
ncbi:MULTISPECIES: hypothetical protein [unclassified Leisingera]|uniref:hypothetical protein n=1 Tax=unclassified Leisingera TaxID=2614906 RepID=UPI00101260B4|nr:MULTISPECIES: hypothetical protein [unclassified Leisingera]MCF6433427.1 hypothetical protein [Leisingera sp. MMG026]QAX32406.1 hypothetical protein ETW24_23780 [Leisingera sp. NJS204]